MRQAHLLLPSPLGLLEYDILEEAAFVGPRRKGGLVARPTPFQGAQVAFAWTDAGFVVRPLPGAPAPDINGTAVTEDVPLSDGDRVRIGEDVAMFRSARGLVSKPVPRPVAPPPMLAPPEPARERPNLAVWALGVAAGALVLFAAVRGFEYIKSINQSKEQLRTRIDPAPRVNLPTADRLTRELDSLYVFETGREARFQTLIDRYRDFAKTHGGTPQGDAAEERVRDLREKWAASERYFLESQVQTQIEGNAFAAAITSLNNHMRVFGDVTPKDVSDLRARVREAAQRSFDDFEKKAAALVVRSPRQAYSMLLAGLHQFPPDMLAPLTPLIDRAAARMQQARKADNRGRGPNDPPGRGPGAKTGNGKQGGAGETGGPDKTDAGLTNKERDREMQMQAAWRSAVEDLRAGKYADALQGYTALIQQYGDTHTYRATKSQISAGRLAAKVGLGGPPALLRAPAKMHKGRLTVSYDFGRSDVFENDWSAEEPFATGEQVRAEWKNGAIHMRGGSGIFLQMVFTSDVRIKATVRVEVAKDLGLLAVEESDNYRALIFALNNSKFRLKKGAGVGQPGHLLWLMGKGVWGAADDDFHGYIKIAEKTKSTLTGGDLIEIEMIRKNDQAQGSFKGKSDAAKLSGRIRGDDKSTIGNSKVGVFTWGGNILVESVRIEGTVDMAWFAEQLRFLVDSDAGPP